MLRGKFVESSRQSTENGVASSLAPFLVVGTGCVAGLCARVVRVDVGVEIVDYEERYAGKEILWRML